MPAPGQAHLGTQAGNTQLTKAQLEIVSRAAHKSGCQSVEVSVVFKSISLHYLAVFRQILVTILPSLLFRAPPVMHLTFLESVLGWGGCPCPTSHFLWGCCRVGSAQCVRLLQFFSWIKGILN